MAGTSRAEHRLYDTASNVTPSAIPIADGRSVRSSSADRFLAEIELLLDALAVVIAIVISNWVYQTLDFGRNLRYPMLEVLLFAFAFAAVFVVIMERSGAYRP